MRLSQIVAATVLIGITFSLFAEVPRYTITDLGTLGGETSSAIAVNNSGQVTGVATTANGGSHAFVTDNDGNMIDLGTPVGSDSYAYDSYAYAINDSGQVTGSIAYNKVGHAHIFVTDNDGNMIDLGRGIGYAINDSGQITGVSLDIPGYSGLVTTSIVFIGDINSMDPIGWGWGRHGIGMAINNSGQVAGYIGYDDDNSNNVLTFITDNDGNMIDFGMPGVSSSYPNAINDSGQVTGIYFADGFSTFGDSHAFVTDIHGNMIDLGRGEGIEINNSGQVTGHIYTDDGGTHAFVTDNDGNIIDLGTLGGTFSRGKAINDNGYVIGSSSDHAFITDSNAKMIDLDGLVDNLSNSWKYIGGVVDISNTGYITGTGTTLNGETHAYLLTPIVTPIKPKLLLVRTYGLDVLFTWNSVNGANGYKLYYAPHPYPGPKSIRSFDVGNTQHFSIKLWEGAAYYVAIRAYNSAGESGYSNIEQFSLK